MLSVDNASEAVLHSVYPFSTILTAVRISVCSFSMFFVELIVALVLATVLPYVGTKPMHHSILERALEVAAVSPLEAPMATHLIV